MKTAAADRLVTGAAFLVVLLAASLVAAIPIYADAVAESSLRARLARVSVEDANVQLAVDVFAGGADSGLDRRVRELVGETFDGVPATTFASGESEPFRAEQGTIAFGFVDDIASHAELESGRWPETRQSPFEVALPAAVASDLGLRVGDVVRAQSRLDPTDRVSARLVGTYRPEQTASAFWWGDPLATAGAGPFVTTRESFDALGLRDQGLRWRVQPDTGRLTLGEAAGVRRRLAGLPARLNEGRPAGQQFDVQTNLPDVLEEADHSLHLARAGVLVPFIQLALLAAYGLIVTTALLLERRYRVTESLRLRGGTALQITSLALVEATLIAVPAVLLAPWLAAVSMRALNHVGPLADVGVHLEPHVTGTSYLLSAAAGVVCVLGLALPALRARRVSVARERRRPALAGLAQRARLDLVVAALALLGYWQLRRYHGTLVSHEGSLGIDPFLVAAPAVLLLAGALLSLRAVPLVARLVERWTPGSRGTVSALGFRQLARRPRAYSRSALLLVLAVAIGVFATTYASTWHRSQIDQARHAAGADVRVEPSGTPGSPPTVDLRSSYASLGATEALPVASDSFSIGGGGTEVASLLALDARRASRVVHVRKDFARSGLDELLRPLAQRRGALASLPLPGRPSRVAITLRLDLEHGDERERPSLYLYLRDGDGLLHVYRLPAAVGAERRHVIDLAYRLPDGTLARPSYPLSVVGLELDVTPGFVTDRRAGLAVRSLETAAGPSGPWHRVSLGKRWRGSAAGFEYAYLAPKVSRVTAADGALEAVASTGSTVSRPPQFGFGNARSTAKILLRPGTDTLSDAMPVLVSDSFLDAADVSVGDELPLALSAGTRRVEIVGSFHRFPTLAPETPAVVADVESYVAGAFVADQSVVQPAAWWLASPDDRRVAERLRAAPFRSITVVSRTADERAALDDPVAVGVIGALALGFVVAAIFAVAGFAANAAAEARSRKLELAVLRSLGLRRTELTRLVGLETALVVVASLVAGALLGLVVSRLVLPDVGLGASGATPVPPVRLVVPWTSVLLLELALLAALAAVGAIQVEVVRRLRLASALRAGEGVAAP
ncbi:MAG TPA: ABC transporter permease [Gaiella sp.]|nr:ABC transporter permease [Gaiella sp.]